MVKLVFILCYQKATSHPTEAVFKVSYKLFLFNQKIGTTLSQKVKILCRFKMKGVFKISSISKDSKILPTGNFLMKIACLRSRSSGSFPLRQTLNAYNQLRRSAMNIYIWKIENFSKNKIDKKKSHEKKFTAWDYLW
ncbi:hypothetical protein MA16_Dca019054 [Dendrobium catenatum]|uniref:MATH domain-containing protein n=1 Tax=Dendrobium catenatum TaxID=906689 RepID=A0A2I0W2C6_9ASPA|nr:hypothetical protein MA16_Dca019054 [Dendrobium catenatum]